MCLSPLEISLGREYSTARPKLSNLSLALIMRWGVYLCTSREIVVNHVCKYPRTLDRVDLV